MNTKHSKSNLASLFAFSALFLLTGACKMLPIGKAYHNTTAKYNAWYLAWERMEQVELKLAQGHKDDYTRPLDVFTGAREKEAEGAKEDLNYVMKKASIPIQRHPKSNWVDDCYLLIGKSRYYLDDYENATQTFKFINTKSTDEKMQAEALTWLMRTYLKKNKMEAAAEVSNYIIRKLRTNLTRRTKAHFYLTEAEYFIRTKDFEKAVRFLVVAQPLLRGREQRSRIHFLTGQLYQLLENDELSYLNYKAALRKATTYDREFHSKMRMAQVAKINDQKEIKQIRKYFDRILNDPKNEDLKGPIYYQLALFELKQGNKPKTFELLELAAKESKSAPEKAQAYLKAGQLYFADKDFVNAQPNYKSAVEGMDKQLEIYPPAARRSKILDEFMIEYKNVGNGDSLLALSRMDTTELNALIDKQVEEELKRLEKEEKEAEKLAKQAKRQGSGGGSSAFDPRAGGFDADATAAATDIDKWYFYNPASLALGRSQFKSKWGDRPLEDNWRYSKKEKAIAEMTNSNTDTASVAKTDSVQTKTADKDSPEDKAAEIRRRLLAKIPKPGEATAEQETKVATGLLNLGKIYDQKLEEKELAIETFERLIKNYPAYDRRPEAMYNLCLLYKKLKPYEFEKLKNELIDEYPKSLFAKLIINPDYIAENEARNLEINPYYNQAFEYYKSGRFVEASQLLDTIIARYPESDYEDKISLLKVMVIGQTLDTDIYRKALNQYITNHPKSESLPFAKDLLKSLDEYEKKTPKETIPKGDEKKLFEEYIDGEQYYVLTFPIGSVPVSEIKNAFSTFHQNFYDGVVFTTTDMLFDNKIIMIYVQSMANKQQAEMYFRRINESKRGPIAALRAVQFSQFLATPNNFKLLYRNKALSEYLKLFSEKYSTTL